MQRLQTLDAYIPIDLLTFGGAGIAFLVVLFFVLSRYFLFTGLAYLYFWKSNLSSAERLHDGKLAGRQVRSEVYWSILSSFIFAASGVLLGVLWQLGLARFYLDFDHYGWAYLPISFIVYTLFHEAYFYFTHLWMHRPKWYRKVHFVHHQSIKTSPWASFSFHPYECLIHAAFLPMMVMLVPIHPVVMIGYLTFMTLTAISNHLGFEIISSDFIKQHLVSGAHHSKHHMKANCNYGLYYTFLDRLMGTEAGTKMEPVSRRDKRKLPTARTV